jgi:hypothetical protein
MRRLKAIVLEMTCRCGKQWTQIFSSRVVKRRVPCPDCKRPNGTSKNAKEVEDCKCSGCCRNRTSNPCEWCNHK